MPKAEATGLAPAKSAATEPPALHGLGGSLLLGYWPISLVKLRSGGLGHFNATTARRALQILLWQMAFNPKSRGENNLRMTGEKIVTRYIMARQGVENLRIFTLGLGAHQKR